MAPTTAAITKSQGLTSAVVARALIARISVDPGTTVPITGIASESARRRIARKAKYGCDPTYWITPSKFAIVGSWFAESSATSFLLHNAATWLGVPERRHPACRSRTLRACGLPAMSQAEPSSLSWTRVADSCRRQARLVHARSYGYAARSYANAPRYAAARHVTYARGRHR